jgi:hypothetical protein
MRNALSTPTLSACTYIQLSLLLSLSLSLSLAPPPLSLSFSPSLTSEQGAHTVFTSQRERKRGAERERDVEYVFHCPELLFLFLKGMIGTLAPFSYLVYNKVLEVFSISM